MKTITKNGSSYIEIDNKLYYIIKYFNNIPLINRVIDNCLECLNSKNYSIPYIECITINNITIRYEFKIKETP